MNNFAQIISKWKALCLCLALTHAGHAMDMDDEQKSVFKSRSAFFEKNSSDSSYGHMPREGTSTLLKPRLQEKTLINTDTRINISKEERAVGLEEKRQKSLSYARKIGCAVEETASYKDIQDAITERKHQQQREKEERAVGLEEKRHDETFLTSAMKKEQHEQRQKEYLEKLMDDAGALGISCWEDIVYRDKATFITHHKYVPKFGIEDIDVLKRIIRDAKQEQYDQRQEAKLLKQEQYVKQLKDDCIRLGIDVSSYFRKELSTSDINYLKAQRQRKYDEKRREKAVSLGLPSYASSDEIGEVISERRREFREARDQNKREREARRVSARQDRIESLEKKVSQERSSGHAVSYKDCLEIRNYYSQSSCKASTGERCGCNCCIGY